LMLLKNETLHISGEGKFLSDGIIAELFIV